MVHMYIAQTVSQIHEKPFTTNRAHPTYEKKRPVTYGVFEPKVQKFQT